MLVVPWLSTNSTVETVRYRNAYTDQHWPLISAVISSMGIIHTVYICWRTGTSPPIRQTYPHICKDASALTQCRVFTIDGVDLKKVETFKYLGRQIWDIDLDTTALFMNLCKTHKRLNHLFCCLIARKKGADPVVGGKIYVAAVISVLLYRSETWVWNLSMLNIIHSFHHCASWRLANKRTKQLIVEWYLWVLWRRWSIRGLQTVTDPSVYCSKTAAGSYLHREES